MKNLAIYFLHHSAVCVNINNLLLIFDHYKHCPAGSIAQGVIGEKEIADAKRVYFFVSHSHSDHYNSKIFEWANTNVFYILDETVQKQAAPENTVFLRAGGKYDDGFISAAEFGSTDCGGSFFVSCQGINLFHAGDLNDWHWKDCEDERYSRNMSVMFRRELERIRQNVDRIDYAFFPVDKRMGTDFDSGADLFIKLLKPRNFIPIHFVSFEDTFAYKAKMQSTDTNIIAVKKAGQRLV